MGNPFKGLSGKWNEHLLRNVVIAIGVVLVWRGVWHLADQYLFPNHPTLSNVLSLVLGILILYFPDGKMNYLGGYNEDVEEKEEKKENLKSGLIAGSIIVLLVVIIVLLVVYINAGGSL